MFSLFKNFGVTTQGLSTAYTSLTKEKLYLNTINKKTSFSIVGLTLVGFFGFFYGLYKLATNTSLRELHLYFKSFYDHQKYHHRYLMYHRGDIKLPFERLELYKAMRNQFFSLESNDFNVQMWHDLWYLMFGPESESKHNCYVIFLSLLILSVLLLAMVLPKTPLVMNRLKLYISGVLAYFCLFFVDYNFTAIELNAQCYTNYWFEYRPMAIIFMVMGAFFVITFLLATLDAKVMNDSHKIEILLFVLFTYYFSVIIVQSNNLMLTFVAVEALSFLMYIFANIHVKNRLSASIGIRYLILGGIPAGFFGLGISLIYYTFGTLSIYDLGRLLEPQPIVRIPGIVPLDELQIHLEKPRHFWGLVSENFSYFMGGNSLDQAEAFYAGTPLTIYVAVFFIFIAFLFKAAGGFMFFWAPQVYQASPMVINYFSNTFSKILLPFMFSAIFIIPFNQTVFLQMVHHSGLVFYMGIVSLAIAFFGAISTNDLKKFLVFSSIGHVGFLLLGFGVFSRAGLTSTVMYSLIYFITNFVVWFILISSKTPVRNLLQLQGLARYNPLVATILGFMFLSMAGIPPFAGFFAKLDVLLVLLYDDHKLIAMMTLVFTVLNAFYYLKIVKIMFYDNISVKTRLKFRIAPAFSLLNFWRFILIGLGFIFVAGYMFVMPSFIRFIIEGAADILIDRSQYDYWHSFYRHKVAVRLLPQTFEETRAAIKFLHNHDIGHHVDYFGRVLFKDFLYCLNYEEADGAAHVARIKNPGCRRWMSAIQAWMELFERNYEIREMRRAAVELAQKGGRDPLTLRN